MPIFRRAAGAILGALLLAAGGPSVAAPKDAKPGDVRAVYARDGTPLRAKASALGSPVASLASGTQVRVLEVKERWLRVQPLSAGAAAGWLRDVDTVEPEALQAAPAPAHRVHGAGGRVTQKELAAAGRQLGPDTERRYRTSRQDLARAYAAVDRMEAASRALDPAESIAFMTEGAIFHAGRAPALPGRVPPSSASPERRERGSRGAGPLGELGGMIGGEVARRTGLGGTAASAIEAAVPAFADGFSAQLEEKGFSPEQEYYIGRAVAAQAIARHGVDPSEKRRHYVRLVGDAIVRTTNRLEPNFGGYHFEVLDSDEVNAISGPGGFVLVTRGAVLAARTESELAGILAHELAHVKYHHAGEVLKRSPQWQEHIARVGGRVLSALARDRLGAHIQNVDRLFEWVADQAATTSINHAYGRELENAADIEGTYLLVDVFYDHVGLHDVLARMGEEPMGEVHTATHASPASRAKALEGTLARYGPWRGLDAFREARTKRLLEATR